MGFVDAQLQVGDVAVIVRALYPTPKGGRARRSPYYSVQGQRVCAAMMACGSPPPLNRPLFSFLMDHLCLLRVSIRQGGTELPLCVPAPAPVLVFSHGLTSTREHYLGIVGELASRGVVVLCVEHTDGTSALARFPDGGSLAYSTREREMERADATAYLHARRRQLELRSLELIAAMDAARALGGATDAPELRAGPRDAGGAAVLLALLRGRVDADAIVAAGHSMGAATAVAAAVRATAAVRACVLLDPATDWLPDEPARAALVGEGGARVACTAQAAGHCPLLPSVRGLEQTAVLTLFSEEWRRSRFGMPHHVRAHVAARGHGPGSEFAYVKGTSHVGFSDVPSTMPAAVARALRFVMADVDATQAILRVRGRVVSFLERLELCAPAPAMGELAAAAAMAEADDFLLESLVLPSFTDCVDGRGMTGSGSGDGDWLHVQ